ncbi:MAG TPA: hypothetical protein VFZ35_06655 [Sphingomicrobium sp.]
MRRPKVQWTAEERIRWLGELARAIDEAQQIVWRLAVLRGDNPRTSELYGQLEAARDEVERLQQCAHRQAKLDLHQDWRNLMASVTACTDAMD